MRRLPVIIGFGGYNAAGRSSFHHAYRRTIYHSLDETQKIQTLNNLAVLMGLVSYNDGQRVDQDDKPVSDAALLNDYQDQILANSLVRKLSKNFFDIDAVRELRNATLDSASPLQFTMRKRNLPSPIPTGWQVQEDAENDKEVSVVIDEGSLSVQLESFRQCEVSTVAGLPEGFDPAKHYPSRFHPRGLQMAVLGASDALNSVGIDWSDIVDQVAPDEIAVYASSAIGQNDRDSYGGMLQARLRSERVSSKQLALGMTSMPTDFVNAYVCNNVGSTGSMVGACASFLYNLRLGVEDIVSGRRRVCLVGGSESNIVPEIIEGFNAMGALATTERLKKLDGLDEPDYQRASRPFGNNCGFTVGESSQYFLLVDDELAMQLGAHIYGAVPHVFTNADGNKKSISSPGAGNYITLAKSVAAASAIAGEEAIRERSFIQAHGSSTPQNRVTESMIFDKVAKGFGIQNWPISAVKAFLGHSLATASGDQLAHTLGVFAEGTFAGIKTVDKVAEDVHDERLDIVLEDRSTEMDVAFINSKGFGGNNASASVLSPNLVANMMKKRYGDDRYQEYLNASQQTLERAKRYDTLAAQGELSVTYNFGNDIIDESAIAIDDDKLTLEEFSKAVNLQFDNPYTDMME